MFGQNHLCIPDAFTGDDINMLRPDSNRVRLVLGSFCTFDEVHLW